MKMDRRKNATLALMLFSLLFSEEAALMRMEAGLWLQIQLHLNDTCTTPRRAPPLQLAEVSLSAGGWEAEQTAKTSTQRAQQSYFYPLDERCLPAQSRAREIT